MKNFNLPKGASPWSCSKMLAFLFLVIFGFQANAQTAVMGTQQTQQGSCPAPNELHFDLAWEENFGLGGALFWTITLVGESEPAYTGQYGYYSYGVPNYTEDFSQAYCLDDGCYNVVFSEAGWGEVITDEFPLTITNGLNENIVEPLTGDLDGYSFQFCIGEVSGCTDDAACNYNALAEISENDLCEYAAVLNMNVDNIINQTSSPVQVRFSYLQGGGFIDEVFMSTDANGSYPVCILNGCYRFKIVSNGANSGFEATITMNGETIPVTYNDQYISFGEGNCITGCSIPDACSYNPDANISDFNACIFVTPGYDCDGNCLTDPLAASTLESFSPFEFSTADCESFTPNSSLNITGFNENESFDILEGDNGLYSPTGVTGTYSIENACLLNFQGTQYGFDANTNSLLSLEPEPFEVYYFGATCSIGLALEEAILGCTDPLATNYNAEATTSDDSCTYDAPVEQPCTDPAACNFGITSATEYTKLDFTSQVTHVHLSPPQGMSVGDEVVFSVEFANEGIAMANANDFVYSACESFGGELINCNAQAWEMATASPYQITYESGYSESGTFTHIIIVDGGQEVMDFGDFIDTYDVPDKIYFYDQQNDIYELGFDGNIEGVSSDLLSELSTFDNSSFDIAFYWANWPTWGTYHYDYITPQNNTHVDLSSSTCYSLDSNNDGICDFESTETLGCTDETACNFDPEATQDNDACEYLSCSCGTAVFDMEVEQDCLNLETALLGNSDFGCAYPSDFNIAWNGNDDVGYLIPSSGAEAAYVDLSFCEITYQDALAANYVSDYGLADVHGLVPGNTFIVHTEDGNYYAVGDIQETDIQPTSISLDFAFRLIEPDAAGCIDEAACNYDPEVIEEDNSTCVYAEFGFDCEGNCLGDPITEQELINQTYWSVFFADCESGEREFIGEVISFNENGFIDFYFAGDQGQLIVNPDNGTEIPWIVEGNCVVGINYIPALLTDGALYGEFQEGCILFVPEEEGCADEFACNYNPETVINNWDLCDYSCSGCMDVNACNYNPEATIEDYCEYTFDFELVEFLEPIALVVNEGTNMLGVDPVGMVFIYEADTDEIVTSFTFSLVEEDVNFYTCLADGCYYITLDYPEDYEGLEFDMDYGQDTDEDLDGYLNNQRYYFTFGETSCIGGCFDIEADNYNPSATYDNEQCVYNDNCENAIELVLNGEPVMGTNLGATGTWAEDQCLDVDEDDESYVNSVWYSLTVPQGAFVVRTILDGTMSDSSMDIYMTCDLESIIDCNDDDDDLESAIYFDCGELNAGSTILVRVDGYDDSTGSFSIVAESSEILGCTFSMADNYDPCATVDDESCIIIGCTDQAACNFNVLANTSGECDYDSCLGCMDTNACNYDQNASIFDPSLCNYTFVFESNNDFIPLGQVGEQAIGYGVIFTIEDDFVTEFPIYLESNTLEGLCLEPGCYYFGFDVTSGFENNTWTIALDGEDEISGDFGNFNTVYFSFGGETCPLGCTDEEADNYDFFASADDGSCLYNDFCISAQELFIDSEAIIGDNTNAGGSLNEADCFDDDDVVNSVWFQMEVPEGAFLIRTILDGSMDDSMMEVYQNCSDTESLACNDDEDDLESQVEFECGELNPGEIIFVRIDGYDESVGTFTIMAESIEENIEGCTDEMAANYDACANVEDESCQYEGCTDESAVNYDENASIDDGSCEYGGCTDETAVNFNELASIDDGSCDYEGCTDRAAINYNPDATIDDGSCEYECYEPTVQYGITGCDDNDDTFSIELGVLNADYSGPFIISNNLNDEELMVTEDGDYVYGEFDQNDEVVIILTSIVTPDCFVSSGTIACALSLEEETTMQWNVYPNPANAQVNLSLDPSKISVINVYDATGRIVESHVANQNQMLIYTNNWSAGLYHIQAIGEGFVETKTLVIQH